MEQLHNLAKLPFIHEHVAGMPDVHYGIGATVGSVIATKGAIVPAAVDVDIGYGILDFRLVSPPIVFRTFTASCEGVERTLSTISSLFILRRSLSFYLHH
jgi:tRNA-splicing ligase RtcB